MDQGTRGGATGVMRVIAGRYELLERIGAGGMGAVWRARDSVLDREVALKEVLFPPGLPPDERAKLRERTRREARAAARLHHPNVVTVYDVVQDGDDPFIVLELVAARTLAEAVRADGPMPPDRAAQMGLAVLSALTAAHKQGIVHRDVKPSNVMLCAAGEGTGPGRVVLTDFGIATSSGDSSMTSTGLLLGSPSYIAPERARGLASTASSDLWSLGATLFYAVEGRAPFDGGEPLATLAALATGDRAPFVAAGALEPVITGLLEPDPDRRLDAAAARQQLQEVAVSGAPTAAAPRPATPEEGARTDRTTVLPVGGAVAAEAHPAEPAAPVLRPRPEPAPARPAARPARPAPVRRRRSLLPLVLAAVLLLGALVGAVALLQADDRDPAGGTAQEPAGQAPADGTSGADDADPGAGDDASAPAPQPPPATGEDDAAAPAPGGPVPAPEGWRTYTGGPGWTAAVPASYRQGTFNGAPEYRDPATGRTLRVETTGPGQGGADAVQDRRDQAASFSRRHSDYREISIERIDYRGYEAADWEFTYSSGGTSLHALSRVFVVDRRGYSLYFQTRASDDWEAARAEFEKMSASFLPA